MHTVPSLAVASGSFTSRACDMQDLFCFETTLGTVLILDEPSGTQVWSPLASVLKLASGCGTLVQIIKEPQVAFVYVGVYRYLPYWRLK